MNRFLCSRFARLGILLCVGLVAGCGGKKAAPQSPVSGKVTVDGQPVTSGIVSLIAEVGDGPPKGKSQQGGGISAGQIGSDGTYNISTGGKTGAPLGKYKVTVVPSMMPSPDGKPPAGGFDQKYSDARKTPLQIEVVASPAAGAYDLKLTK